MKKLKIGRKLQSFVKRIYNINFISLCHKSNPLMPPEDRGVGGIKRSLILAIFLFIISAATPPVIAISSPTTIVQTQQDGTQLANQATKLYRTGQFKAAATAWKQTADVFAAQRDSLNQAMALSNLSLTYQQLGEWEAAKKAIEESLALLKTVPEVKEKLKIQAQAWDVQGYLQREMGQSTDALNTWQQATKIYGKIDEQEKLAQSKINQAQAMQDLGLYPRACNTLLEVVNKEVGVKNCQELAKINSEKLQENLQKISNESPITTVLGLRSLGEVQRVMGQLEQSNIILETSLKLAQKLKYPQEEAFAYLSLANTAQALTQGQIDRIEREKYRNKALEYYSQVVKLSPSPATQQQAQLNQLGMLLKFEPLQPAQDKLDQLKTAADLWRSLYPQLSNLSPSRTAIYQQINFAQSEQTLVELAQKENFTQPIPSFNETNQILVRAIEQAKSLGDKRAEAYAVGNLGKLYELSGKRENLLQAEKFTQQAVNMTSSFAAPDIAYQFFWQLGRIRKTQGNIEEAIAAYTKSYNALQSLRSDLLTVNPEVQYSFRESVEPIYRQLVELDLTYAESLKGKGKNEDSQKRLIQAREVIESLQLAEINNFFREVCVRANAEQIDKIDKTAAVIYPIILPDRLEVILSLPNQPPSLYTTKIERKELEPTIAQVQKSLIAPDSILDDFLPVYKKVYEWLVKPLMPALKENSNIKTLAFVLDGDLRNIPMAILHDGNQFLVQKYALALTPGLQLVNPKPLAQINLKALAAGLEMPQDENFRPLPNVKLELEQIRKFGLSDRLILNNQFTKTQLKKEIVASRVPPIVHLATHGRFSSRSEDTFILSWDGRINVKELGEFLQNNTLYQATPIELLVLSACETASGDKRATLGLAGVSVRAGARSTLATLWSVVDESTAKIMGEFYDQLKKAKAENKNKVEALRQAQLALMKDQKYSHPHFWAPFVLVGNWQ